MNDMRDSFSIHMHRVQRLDDLFVCELPGRGFVPVKQNDEPVRTFLPGWTPVQAYSGLTTVVLLEFCHVDGAQALWFLDPDLNYMTNTTDEIDAQLRAEVRYRIRQLISGIVRSILCEGVLRLSPPAISFLSLGKQVRDGLVGEALSGTDTTSIVAIPRSTMLCINDLTDDAIDIACRPHLPAVDVPAIRRILHSSILELAPGAVFRGEFCLPSPITGQTISGDAALPLGTVTAAYRFADPGTGTVFFAIATQHFVHLRALYFPTSGICLTADGSSTDFLEHVLGFPIEASLVKHVIGYLDYLVPYVGRQGKRIVAVYEQNHLGHHLWQELTGALEMARRIPAMELPELYVISSTSSEMFGHYEELFPEYLGKVNRSCRSLDEFRQITYTHGLFPITPTGIFIPQQLRGRIVELADNNPDVGNDWALLEMVRRMGWPIILLGLRVENRTVVDFPQFCAEVIDCLSKNTEGALVIIDGHSAAKSTDPTVFMSHGSALAAIPPIQVEREIIAALRQRFRGGNIVIADTVGATMVHSIFWSTHCDFFIAPWGAGLAKYRWVANKPGLVVAGREFLKEGVELQIYMNAELMEAPTPVHVLGEEFVQDAPEVPSLVPLSELSRVNFRVDFRGVERRLKVLLANVASEQSGAPQVTDMLEEKASVAGICHI